MVDRLVRWRLVGHRRPATIVALDGDPEAVSFAQREFGSRQDELALAGVKVEFICSTLADAAQREPGRYDLVLAHHVLDLLHLEEAVPQLRALAAPGGLFWFTLTFDGRTCWSPTLDRRLDAAIEARFHATMDSLDGTCHSQAGRRLAEAIEAAGGIVAAAGRSWWRITPRETGYHASERAVLESMLGFHRASLRDEISPNLLDCWLREREAQLADGRLGLLVRHRDVAGWFDPPSTVVHPVSARNAEPRSR